MQDEMPCAREYFLYPLGDFAILMLFMKSVLFFIISFFSFLPLMGFDTAKLHLDITRDQSSEVFSNDYRYVVLEDATVRRIWDDGSRRLSLDFQPEDGSLICGRIRYMSPVKISDATRELNTIARTSGKGWRKTDPKKIEQLGFRKALFSKISNKSYFFAVLNEAGQVSSINFYSSVPRSNRYSLAEGSTKVRQTGLGSSSNQSAEQIAYLKAQEAELRNPKDTGLAVADPSTASRGWRPNAQNSAKPSVAKSTSQAELSSASGESIIAGLDMQTLLIIIGAIFLVAILYVVCFKGAPRR